MAAQHVFAAPNNNNVGIHYKPPPENVLPVDINALVPGQMYHIWSADPNNLGQYHGMVGIFQRLFLDYYFFNYEGVLNSQNILVNKDWRPLYAGEGPDPVYLRIRHDRAGEYLIYPINAADIDNGNNAAMNQNGGKYRRTYRRQAKRRRSQRRRTPKNNRR